MAKLVVVVPATRAYCGRLVLLGHDGSTRLGPLRVLATASRRVARRHGNPRCDPRRPFGHPPAGAYVVASSLPPGHAHARRPRRFGTTGALLLAPKGSRARASVENGQRTIALHGGPLDPKSRLRPTRGGLRLSDDDMNALLRAINAAQAAGDPLDGVEIVEATDLEVQSVPPLDLRGARKALGVPPKVRRRKKKDDRQPIAAPRPMLLLLLGLGATKGAERRVDRRAFLQAALVAVGGLVATACSNQPSPCTPLACDPGEPLPDDAGAPPASPCPPAGYVCEEDDTTYVGAGGGVG